MIRSKIISIEHNSEAKVISSRNNSRIGGIIENYSNAVLLIAFSERECSEQHFSVALDPRGTYELPPVTKEQVYPGEIQFKFLNPTQGRLMFTEFFEKKERNRRG